MNPTLSLNPSEWAAQSLRGEALSHQDALAVLQTPDSALPALLQAARRVREAHFSNRVKVCVLLNAQSGICPEDCGYCSQSKVSGAPVEKYKLLPQDVMLERAKIAAQNGAKRFCMVIAARGPQPRDIEHLGQAVRRIKADAQTAHLEICTSLGLMNDEACRQLKDAGVDYVNHNLNTSEAHYPNVCSSHTYADRIQTLGSVQNAGLKTCSGGIVGLGESDDDLISMGFALRAMQIESIPINFLLPIGGTRMANNARVTPERGLKVLCLMRLLNPDKEVRVAAGRETLGREREVQALWVANSLFVDGYLTTQGDKSQDVREWLQDAGFQIETA